MNEIFCEGESDIPTDSKGYSELMGETVFTSTEEQKAMIAGKVCKSSAKLVKTKSRCWATYTSLMNKLGIDKTGLYKCWHVHDVEYTIRILKQLL